MASQGLISADSGKPTGAETPADALGEPKRMSTSDAESQESYECPKCDSSFDTKHSLGVHFWAAHDKNLQEWERENTGKNVECPTCGRSDFTSERPMRLHHYRSHGESIAYEKFECDWCSSEFEELECKQPRFCSQSCADKGRLYTEKPWTDEDTLRRLYIDQELSATQISNELGCGHVTAMEWLREYSIRQDLDKYNCPNCGAGFHGRNNVTTHMRTQHGDGDFDTLVRTECDNCSTTLQLKPAVENAYERHFCDRDCKTDWQRENQKNVKGWPPTGADSAAWEGGPYEYGEGWNDKKKRSVRERDGYECQDCGLSNDDHKQAYGRALDVHHIRPARAFDDDHKCNHPDNLVTLCIPCHNKWEGIPLRPQ